MSENKQSVLMVHNYYQIPGGEDTVVANEKKMLEEHGHKVVLYTRNNAELKTMNLLQKMLLPFTTIFNPKTYREIKKIIKKEKIDIKNMSVTQLVLKINNVIEKYISNELRKDGGDIELIDVKDNKVFVALKGMCKSCKFSSNTLKNFVEASLKEHISPDIEVVEV